MPVPRKRRGGDGSHAPTRAERPTHSSRTPPLGRNQTIGYRTHRPLSRDKTVRPRDRAQSRPLPQRPLNRETLNDRPTLLAVPQRATDQPEQPIERSKHDSQTRPENGDARIDDEPFHHEAHGTSASATTTRKPAPRPHTTRVVERARERDAITESHFQSNLSRWTHWHVAVSHCHTVSHNVNTVLLQCSPNLLNLLLIHATNTNATVNLTVTVLNNFKLKRDTVQAKNDLPAQ